MTCPDFQSWNLLSMNLVDADEAKRLRGHLDSCERCQAAWQEADGLHRDLQRVFATFDKGHDQLREQLLARLPESTSAAAGSSKGALAMILRRHSTRWAALTTLAAASILLVVMLHTSGRVAFADVLENMRQAKTMVCDVVTKITLSKSAPGMKLSGLEEPIRGRMSMYVDGDTRAVLNEINMPEMTTVVGEWGERGGEISPDPAGKSEIPPAKFATIRNLFRDGKAYVWTNGKLQVLESLESYTQSTPEQWLSSLLQVQDRPDRQLGEKMINGLQATGFEIAGWKLKFGTKPTEGNATPSDSNSVVRVWVDVERDLPVQIEVDQEFVTPQMAGTQHSVYENIQWNVPLDPADFQPPSEEELAQATTINVPTVDESALTDFLEAWLESGKEAQAAIETMKQKAKEKGEPLPQQLVGLVEGQSLAEYPEKLDTNWLSGAYVARQTVARTAETILNQEPIPEDAGAGERLKRITQSAQAAAQAAAQATQDAMLEAIAASAFYQRLANEGHEPEYFGAIVKPGDAKAVLVRWKLGDGRVRVIYGDLRAETVEDVK